MSAHHVPSCPVCGFRFGAGDVLYGIVALGIAYRGQKYRRWPRRKRSGVWCPECARIIVVATELSRNAVEVSFL